MTYRPTAAHRQNIQGVIIPLTAAIHRVFGSRAQDGARPLGAFYTVQVKSSTWQHLGGIWYRPFDEESIAGRNPNEGVVNEFCQSILSGQSVVLPSSVVVEWEPLDAEQEYSLPPPLRHESDA